MSVQIQGRAQTRWRQLQSRVERHESAIVVLGGDRSEEPPERIEQGTSSHSGAASGSPNRGVPVFNQAISDPVAKVEGRTRRRTVSCQQRQIRPSWSGVRSTTSRLDGTEGPGLEASRTGVEFQPVQPFGLTMFRIVHSVKHRERAQYGLWGPRRGGGQSRPFSSRGRSRDGVQFDPQKFHPHRQSLKERARHCIRHRKREVTAKRRHPRRKRLRLRWHQETCADTGHRDVRVVSHLVENLARMIGCLP